MPWLLRMVAGLFEVAWAIGLKCTEGFSLRWPSVLPVGFTELSVALLRVARSRCQSVPRMRSGRDVRDATGFVALGPFGAPATLERLVSPASSRHHRLEAGWHRLSPREPEHLRP
jgi:quaternary ammonium compound-resistance protein SugE